MALTKKTGNEKPRPQIGKTADKTRLVRFVDLNKTIDEIEAELEVKDVEILNLQNQVSIIPGVNATTTIVSLSSAQLGAMGTPITLLPAPGVGMYNDYEFILELTLDPTINTNAKIVAVIGSSSYVGTKIDSLETYVAFGQTVFRGSSYSKNTETLEGSSGINESLILTNFQGGNWTSAGTTSGRIIVTNTVRTFGS